MTDMVMPGSSQVWPDLGQECSRCAASTHAPQMYTRTAHAHERANNGSFNRHAGLCSCTRPSLTATRRNQTLALLQEANLIERMYQLTSEFFIGRATEKVILRDVALDFGFDIGMSDYLRGARVAFVDPAGPAYTAGLQKGDIIASVSGRNVMGLDLVQVRRMIQRVVDNDAGMLVVSVAAPLGSSGDHTDETDGVEMEAVQGERAAQDRPKPPSYVVIRNKLTSEFGDAT